MSDTPKLDRASLLKELLIEKGVVTTDEVREAILHALFIAGDAVRQAPLETLRKDRVR